ncbi:hypothetical protein XPA_001673 [Xanthoria parietina]
MTLLTTPSSIVCGLPSKGTSSSSQPVSQGSALSSNTFAIGSTGAGNSDILEIPKKSNRNSEITVPASSVSLRRMEPQSSSFNNPDNHVIPESPVSTRETQKLIAPAVQPEDVEKQAFESWRESEDKKWRKEENTPVGDSSSAHKDHSEQISKKLKGVS